MSPVIVQSLCVLSPRTLLWTPCHAIPAAHFLLLKDSRSKDQYYNPSQCPNSRDIHPTVPYTLPYPTQYNIRGFPDLLNSLARTRHRSARTSSYRIILNLTASTEPYFFPDLSSPTFYTYISPQAGLLSQIQEDHHPLQSQPSLVFIIIRADVDIQRYKSTSTHGLSVKVSFLDHFPSGILELPIERCTRKTKRVRQRVTVRHQRIT